MIKRLVNYHRLHGVRGVMAAMYGRVCPRRARCHSLHADALTGKSGVEVGGPSRVFSARGFFPIYPIIASLDNVTYAAHTIWEGELSPQREFSFDINRQPGRQFILDATVLHEIADFSYDVLLSSHALEHLANPLRGLYEWLRVLKIDGLLVLVLPHLDGTFDHSRPVTSLEHIVADYQNGTTERDDTHLDEIRHLHDLDQDDGVSTREEFERRIGNNYIDRTMHHHTFSTLSTAQLLNHVGLQILSLETVRPCHIVAVARKTAQRNSVDNKQFLDVSMPLYSNSPFRTDRADGEPRN
jgi:SAM-dependent methyltransferase